MKNKRKPTKEMNKYADILAAKLVESAVAKHENIGASKYHEEWIKKYC